MQLGNKGENQQSPSQSSTVEESSSPMVERELKLGGNAMSGVVGRFPFACHQQLALGGAGRMGVVAHARPVVFFDAMGRAEVVGQVYPVRFEPVGVELSMGFGGGVQSESDSSSVVDSPEAEVTERSLSGKGRVPRGKPKALKGPTLFLIRKMLPLPSSQFPRGSRSPSAESVERISLSLPCARDTVIPRAFVQIKNDFCLDSISNDKSEKQAGEARGNEESGGGVGWRGEERKDNGRHVKRFEYGALKPQPNGDVSNCERGPKGS
ncbi:hypothetical protein CCACVL1_03707 [Corchorus capsularis]|uniref:Uncharacterized protein n=1 Tax=Corchorus capsularis TaxID=210143 RepID=A0A1R3JXR6_COCAP|nr:hypothetical protein CCACVL1_03707 [Corchorus capsularis]